jgi:hypothetical protein
LRGLQSIPYELRVNNSATDQLETWLRETSRRTGVSVGQVVRQQLERSKAEAGRHQFLRFARKVDAPPNLSSRKGFARRRRRLPHRFVVAFLNRSHRHCAGAVDLAQGLFVAQGLDENLC